MELFKAGMFVLFATIATTSWVGFISASLIEDFTDEIELRRGSFVVALLSSLAFLTMID